MAIKVIQASCAPRIAFEVFAIQLEIESIDQLRALTVAAGKMCNGHGLELYTLLKQRLERYEQLIEVGYQID